MNRIAPISSPAWSDLENIISSAWEQNTDFSAHPPSQDLRNAIDAVWRALDQGELRVATPDPTTSNTMLNWHTQAWVKQAILLGFRLWPSQLISASSHNYYDKIPLKCDTWSSDDYQRSGFRVVPGAVIRYSAYIAPRVVVMPSFINVGAYVGENTMVDTWATIGSCAQIGKNCHISGGAGIGGVLEPLQMNPTIIEDDCFIGARCEIAEGVIVGRSSVIAMGTFLGASTKIYDRATGAVHLGRVPPYSVVVPGSFINDSSVLAGLSLGCAVIVKTVDEKTRSKTAINELLRF